MKLVMAFTLASSLMLSSDIEFVKLSISTCCMFSTSMYVMIKPWSMRYSTTSGSLLYYFEYNFIASTLSCKSHCMLVILLTYSDTWPLLMVILTLLANDLNFWLFRSSTITSKLWNYMINSSMSIITSLSYMLLASINYTSWLACLLMSLLFFTYSLSIFS